MHNSSYVGFQKQHRENIVKPTDISPRFVGREKELAQLSSTLGRARPSMAVVYGRRRIGKSALIFQALKDKPALVFEGLENQSTSEQISNFCLQLSRQVHSSSSVKVPRTWREAFFLLEPVLKAKPACIVLDEFQWMANYRSAIVSDLKMAWDQILANIPGVSLVLCGSIASFMLNKVVKSTALYGRTDRVIHLKEFQLADSAKMLPGYGTDELLDAQMILGGVPKYQELVREYPSLYLAIEELAFQENGYLVDEFDRIFVSHFGRNDEYRRIIAALAKHPYGVFRKELAVAAKIDLGGGLTRHLGDLESAGFIRSILPIGKPANSRITKYILSDAYLRFYYALIRPALASIRAGQSSVRFAHLAQRSAFRSWRGRAFEFVCSQHASRIADALGFGGIEYTFGPFFRSASAKSSGVQIDLVFNRADNVLMLCEMKYRQRPLGKPVVNEIRQKIGTLRDLFPTKTIQSVLVYHGSITKEVEHSPFISHSLDASVLL